MWNYLLITFLMSLALVERREPLVPQARFLRLRPERDLGKESGFSAVTAVEGSEYYSSGC